MNGLIFVDTNVLLYAVDQANARKHTIACTWREKLWETRRGRVSFQVLQEFYANVARQWPRSVASARAEVLDLLVWQPIKIDSGILKAGWKVQDRYGINFWDALIVAAAKASSCEVLLSEDFQAGLDFGGLRVVNPFRTEPEEVF